MQCKNVSNSDYKISNYNINKEIFKSVSIIYILSKYIKIFHY